MATTTLTLRGGLGTTVRPVNRLKRVKPTLTKKEADEAKAALEARFELEAEFEAAAIRASLRVRRPNFLR